MGKRACPVCGGTEKRKIREIHMSVPLDYRLPSGYDVVVCDGCGMAYADTDASMGDYDWYYAHCNFYGDDSKDDNSTRYEMVEGLLEEFLDKKMALLDVGAGNGRFELAMRRHGYMGIEASDPSEESVNRLRDAGVEAFVGSIYDDVPESRRGRYDGIFLFEVAEHLLVPREGMARVSEMLKPSGVFIVSVPDYSQIAEDLSCVPNHFNLEHINYFSEDTLDGLLLPMGFERVGQRRVGMDLIQAYRLTGKPGRAARDAATEGAIQAYFQRQRQREEHARSQIQSLQEGGRGVIVWGTGSYVMSLAATTSLLDCDIRAFVDNNAIKQGREMYGRPICPPSFIEGNGDCVVLVCSMLYGGAIRGQLEGMGVGNEVIVL